MKIFPVALCCLISAVACHAQQPASAPMLLVYVQKPNAPPVVTRIALGMAQPLMKISSFEKCASLTDYKGPNKLDGIALQLKADDARVLSGEMHDNAYESAQSLEGGAIYFATPDNKILGYMQRSTALQELGAEGVLVFFSSDDPAIYNYLTATLKPR